MDTNSWANGSDWTFDPENPNLKIVDGVENSAVKVADGSSTLATRAPSVSGSPFPQLLLSQRTRRLPLALR